MAVPGLRRHVVAIVLLAIGSCAIFGACGGGSEGSASGSGDGTRPYMMGFSTMPRELNAAAYADTFKLASENGEMVLIQRTPKWSDFARGATVSDETAKTTAAEKKSIADRKLKLFFAIDPTDSATGRDRLADLPSSLSGRNFGDDDVRAAFASYAEYVALNYKPAYLALGVDMNEYYEKNKDDFDNFKTLYAETYDRVKKISPDTQVTVTFQWEDLTATLPTEDKHYPDWQLLRAFDPKLDIMTISTYPSLAFASVAAIPPHYYTQLRAFTKRPIAIAAMGYASARAGANTGGSDDDQSVFVRRVLADAETINMPFVVWFAAWDPSFAKDSGQDAFQDIGLLRQDGSEKPAWSIWTDAAAKKFERN